MPEIKRRLAGLFAACAIVAAGCSAGATPTPVRLVDYSQFYKTYPTLESLVRSNAQTQIGQPSNPTGPLPFSWDQLDSGTVNQTDPAVVTFCTSLQRTQGSDALVAPVVTAIIQAFAAKFHRHPAEEDLQLISSGLAKLGIAACPTH